MAAAASRGGLKNSKETLTGSGNISGGKNVTPTAECNAGVGVRPSKIHVSRINTRFHTTKDSNDVEKVGVVLKLEPGKTYHFRVAAANAAGRGPWSEVTDFKVPGPEPAANIPGGPTNIKLTAKKGGVKVSWDMPPQIKGVTEFEGFVSVKSQDGSKNGCKFLLVYTGTKKYFTLSREIMEIAAIDRSAGNPAILLRLVAKSDLGYSSAVHVRCVKNLEE